jgi:hypothetical protein
MSPSSTAPKQTTATIEHGRVRVCDDLVLSVNRSWQVTTAPGQRHNAPFKAPAPIWRQPELDEQTGAATFLAAVAAHDAFWFGFETENNQLFAVTIVLNGTNASTGASAGSTKLEANPANFFLVPDQPWFDTWTGPSGAQGQMVPDYIAVPGTTGVPTRTTVDLEIYRINKADVISPREMPGEGPLPLYVPTPPNTGATSAAHPWPTRQLQPTIKAPERCAQVTFHIVQPTDFVALSGTKLDLEVFNDEGTVPPAVFDPFQNP